MITRSLKTEVKTEAIKAAKAFYNDLVLKRAQKIPLTQSSTFKTTAEDLFKEDQGKVNRGERKQSVVDDAKYLYNADLLKFFNKYHVKDITYQRINDYIAHLQESREVPLGSKTIKNHLIVLHKILKQASKLGYLDKIPIFPTITITDNPRDAFTDSEYNNLLEATDELIKAGTVTKELRFLVTFTANSYLRPPDLKGLQNKHIEKVTNDQNVTFLKILAMAKVKPASVIATKAAIPIYADLTKFNEALGFGKPDDYVFFPAIKNRGYAMDTMRIAFNEALDASKLKIGPTGSARTLYSLRHTCIMNRLLHSETIDLLTLAKNCRTSVEMIQRYYGSHLTAEMNAGKLITTKEEGGGSNLAFLLDESNAPTEA